MKEIFRRFAHEVSAVVGSAWAFLVALGLIVVWSTTGPLFHFSDTWQLVINTGTTIVTFLMVFLIQNTQNRDAQAIHLKLDELLRAVKGARTSLVNLEALPDEELMKLRHQFECLQKRYGAGSDHTVRQLHEELEARRHGKRRRGTPRHAHAAPRG